MPLKFKLKQINFIYIKVNNEVEVRVTFLIILFDILQVWDVNMASIFYEAQITVSIGLITHFWNGLFVERCGIFLTFSALRTWIAIFTGCCLIKTFYLDFLLLTTLFKELIIFIFVIFELVDRYFLGRLLPNVGSPSIFHNSFKIEVWAYNFPKVRLLGVWTVYWLV
jgi:hypothetical protein